MHEADYRVSALFVDRINEKKSNPQEDILSASLPRGMRMAGS